jgi:hypothetical protein
MESIMSNEERFKEMRVIVASTKEATDAAHANGVKTGWEAAHLVVKCVVKAWREHYGETGSVLAGEAIMKALDMSKQKAIETFSAPTTEVKPVVLMPTNNITNH